jgi:hypothetical protein
VRWLVVLGVAAAWAALGAVVWTAVRDVRDESRKERGTGPPGRR